MTPYSWKWILQEPVDDLMHNQSWYYVPTAPLAVQNCNCSYKYNYLLKHFLGAFHNGKQGLFLDASEGHLGSLQHFTFSFKFSSI